ncbi:MAG: hypothetical protein JST70_17275 [Bacteroidetes bacterium]|nr:hypothetical protein [Bacteroidota bacterium]
MNLSRYILLTAILMVFICYGCGKKSCGGKRGITYEFDLPVTISPAKDTFRIGDTIWIENAFSDQMYNAEDGKTYTVHNFDFKASWQVCDMNYPPYTYPDPIIIPLSGTTNIYSAAPNVQSYQIKHDYSNGSYKYKAGIVATRSGAYLVSFSTFLKATKVDITECPNEDVKNLTFNTNNGGNNHYEALQYSKDISAAKATKAEFDKYGGYCFYIK